MSLRYAASNRHQNLTAICKQLGIKESEVVLAEQVHGDGIAIATQKDRGKKIVGVDAIITCEKDIPLAVRTADCAPILIFDPVKNILALVHSGRKGTEKELTFKAIQKMKEKFDSTSKDLVVKIGPCIGKCCYPVDLRKEILKELANAGVPEEKVEVNPDCTCCHKEKYFSYRGEGPKAGRMFLVATLGNP